jgi:hypothetical protein
MNKFKEVRKNHEFKKYFLPFGGVPRIFSFYENFFAFHTSREINSLHFMDLWLTEIKQKFHLDKIAIFEWNFCIERNLFIVVNLSPSIQWGLKNLTFKKYVKFLKIC